MNRRQLLSDAQARLLAAGASDARLDAQWLLSRVTGVPRLSLLMALEAPVTDGEAAQFARLLSRREAGQPLQYVLGEAAFMGHTLRVDPRVLIPRADTETLAEEAIRRTHPGMRVLDLGAGSGALAIAIKLQDGAVDVTAVDISAEALSVAVENAERLRAAVRFVQGDLYAPLAGERFDLIVSNPPYIPSEALSALQREVRWEPALALDGGADGLAFYRRIVRGLPEHLTPGGSLLLEVGDGQAEAVRRMLDGQFTDTNTVRDLAGLDRVVIGDDYAG